MKIILLTLAICNVHASVILGATTTEKYPTAPRGGGIEDFMEEKCLENSPSNDTYQNLKKAVADYDRCQRKILSDESIPHPVEQHDEFCRYFEESQYYSCMENLANSALPCLDKSEIFFPNMMLEAYNTTFETFCGNNGLRVTEYFFNKFQRNKECIRRTIRSMVFTGKCFENLTSFQNFMQSAVELNQQEYCTDMESFVDCATKLVQQQCHENFHIIKYYFSVLFLSVC